jgi:fatty acid amide hydrolase 2
MFNAVMNNGQFVGTDMNKTVQELQTEPYKPVKELLKKILGKSNYSLHLILYTIFEKLPKPGQKGFLAERDTLKDELNSILGDNSVIIAPSFPYVAPYHNQPVLTGTFDFVYFGIWNILRLPVTQCPMGLCGETGLPVGLQVVSNERCDHLTISIAEYLEKNNISGWTPGF